jgi:hypothetical protein
MIPGQARTTETMQCGQRYRVRLRYGDVIRELIGVLHQQDARTLRFDLRPKTPWLHQVSRMDVTEVWETDAPVQLERPLPNERRLLG